MHFCFYSFLIHFCFLILCSPHAHEIKRWNDAAKDTLRRMSVAFCIHTSQHGYMKTTTSKYSDFRQPLFSRGLNAAVKFITNVNQRALCSTTMFTWCVVTTQPHRDQFNSEFLSRNKQKRPVQQVYQKNLIKLLNYIFCSHWRWHLNFIHYFLSFTTHLD